MIKEAGLKFPASFFYICSYPLSYHPKSVLEDNWLCSIKNIVFNKESNKKI
jgi:hypothetical protein